MSTLQKIIMGKKSTKVNKYQWKSELTWSIWLEEDDLKSSWLNSDFGESKSVNRRSMRISLNPKLKQRNQVDISDTGQNLNIRPLGFGHLANWLPRIYGNAVEIRGVFSLPIWILPSLSTSAYKYRRSRRQKGSLQQRALV